MVGWYFIATAKCFKMMSGEYNKKFILANNNKNKNYYNEGN